MRILLTLAFLMAFSASAHAEGNKITVVGEDGTVTSIDIGPSPLEPSAEPQDKPVNLRRAPPVADPVPVEKPASKKPIAKKQPVKKEVAKKEVKKETKKEAKKPAAAKKKKEKSAKKEKAPKKQAAPASPAPDRAPSRPARLGPHMTPDDAIRIALDVAPPARSVNAYPVNYKGLHAYQVVFKGEDGDRSVFVDRETGRIVK